MTQRRWLRAGGGVTLLAAATLSCTLPEPFTYPLPLTPPRDATAEVQGQAGNGLVQVRMPASGQVQSVRIDPSVVDPDDVETLQDLLVGALHDAARAAQAMQAEKMGPLASGLGGMGGGLGLPGV